MKIFTKKQKYILYALVGIAILALTIAYISTPSGALEVHFLDVGQGDAIFIQTPSRRQVLVDGGYGNKILEQLSHQMLFYDRSIDFVVATHMDADHIGGLLYVLDNFEVGAVLISGMPFSVETPKSSAEDKFFKKIKENGAKLVEVQAGDRFWIDESVYFDVLWPSPGLVYGLSDNEQSLVLKLVYGEDSFLLTGDAEKFTEYKLAQSKIDLTADVLKVAHHGSNTSSVKYFLDKVHAKIAVIQVGENNYGHPHSEVLERLKNKGMQILRNDANGVVSIYSYGNSF